LAFDCWLLGSLFKTLAVLCTQQRWPRVLGHTSSACQKPRAPSATASSGPIASPRRLRSRRSSFHDCALSRTQSLVMRPPPHQLRYLLIFTSKTTAPNPPDVPFLVELPDLHLSPAYERTQTKGFDAGVGVGLGPGLCPGPGPGLRQPTTARKTGRAGAGGLWFGRCIWHIKFIGKWSGIRFLNSLFS
jgi:hypothetical protein